MPELPEVETVRAGLARHVVGRTVESVEVRRASAVRRHEGGPGDFEARLVGRTLTAAVRRGKYAWLVLDDEPGRGVLLVHLRMSGQLLVQPPETPPTPHTRARLALTGPGGDVVCDFVDQRTFGSLAVVPVVPTADGAPGGRGSDLAVVPVPVAHIARDLLDPHLDRPALEAAVRRRRTGIKRALLDQTLVSGIGNIYADEALWRARVHWAAPTATLRRGRLVALLDAAEEVMSEALVAGGTSFDALYVNVNGQSGYFDRSLAAYGRAGSPCRRCGTPLVREAFMNRSSYRCPQCQRTPRAARLAPPGGRVL